MTTHYERADGFVYRQVAGEHLLVALKRNRSAPMFMLTPTGGFVWERLAAWTTPDALADEVVAAFDVTREVAFADVNAFIEQLQSLGAVVCREGDE